MSIATAAIPQEVPPPPAQRAGRRAAAWPRGPTWFGQPGGWSPKPLRNAGWRGERRGSPRKWIGGLAGASCLAAGTFPAAAPSLRPGLLGPAPGSLGGPPGGEGLVGGPARLARECMDPGEEAPGPPRRSARTGSSWPRGGARSCPRSLRGRGTRAGADGRRVVRPRAGGGARRSGWCAGAS